VSSCISGVVLDDLALLDDEPYFRSADHPVWPQHLLQGMWKKQYPLAAARRTLVRISLSSRMGAYYLSDTVSSIASSGERPA